MSSNTELEKFFEDGFERKLFQACLANLNARGNPLRFNNFAYSIRELIRHTLARLAPTGNVENCGWYENSTGEKGKISRGERITYAVQGGLQDEFVENSLDLDVADLRKRLVASIDGLSKFTHVGEDTFGISDDDCDRRAEVVLTALEEFRRLVVSCRSAVVEAIRGQLEESVIEEVLSDSIDSIDELATHHSVEGVDIDDLFVTGIDDVFIYVHAVGFIDVGLQWGSNSDIRNDIGAEGDDSFPIEVDLTVDLNDLTKISLVESTVRVDTSRWYGDDEDLDGEEAKE